MARLQIREAANLPDSGEVGVRMMELRWWMVSILARDCLRLGFKDMLKRMERAKMWAAAEEDLVRARRTGMASAV